MIRRGKLRIAAEKDAYAAYVGIDRSAAPFGIELVQHHDSDSYIGGSPIPSRHDSVFLTKRQALRLLKILPHLIKGIPHGR